MAATAVAQGGPSQLPAIKPAVVPATATVQPPSVPQQVTAALSNPTPTSAQLLQSAIAEANANVQSKTAPLQAEQQSEQQVGNQAVAGIGQEFKQLLPSVADSASRLEAFQKNTLLDSQAVASQASQNLNEMQQNAAAQAQQLAQRIGGPVSTGQFTAATAPYAEAAIPSGAIGTLASIGAAQTGATAAETFAGQVFPALATEEEAKARTYYQDQVTKLQDEINKVDATKGTLVQSDYASLQKGALTEQLNQAKLALSNQKQQQDWSAKQIAISQQDQRIQISQESVNERIWAQTQHDTQAAATLAERKSAAAATLAERTRADSIRLSEAEQRIVNQASQAAARLGVSKAGLAIRVHQYAITNSLAQQRGVVAEQKNAAATVDAALTPGGGKPVTLSVKVPIPTPGPGVLLKPNPNLVQDPKTGQWYEWTKRTLTPAQWAGQSGVSGTTPVADPNRLYQLLTEGQIPNGIARATIIERLGLPTNWKPGKPTTTMAGTTTPVTPAPTSTIPPLTTDLPAWSFPGPPA